jgi:hypothetical protein
VFVLDWSDTGECHEANGVHRTSGRIYKIFHAEPKPATVGDLAKMSATELVQLQLHPNEWFVRQARLELATRSAAGRDLGTAPTQLHQMFTSVNSVTGQLRALWTLYAIGAADEEFLRAQLHHPDEHVRAWAIRLLSDTWPLDTVMSTRPIGRAEATTSPTLPELVRLAQSDPSGLVRLALASTLQRLPVAQRAELAALRLCEAAPAAEVLAELAEGHPEPRIRALAALAIGRPLGHAD